MKILILLSIYFFSYAQLTYKVGAKSEFNRNIWNSTYSQAGEVNFHISNTQFNSSLHIFINQEAEFKIGLEDFFIETANGDIIEIINAKDKVTPDIYRLSHLAELKIRFPLTDNLDFTSSTNIYKQFNRATRVDTFTTFGFLNIDDISKTQFKSDIGLTFYNDNISFGFGFHNLDLYQTQDDLRYQIDLKKGFYFKSKLTYSEYSLKNYYTAFEESYSFEADFGPLVKTNSLKTEFMLSYSGNNYVNSAFDFTLSYDYNEAIQYQVGFRKLLKSNSTSDKSEFIKYFSENSKSTFLLTDFISIGATVNLSARRPNPLALTNINLESTELFQSKAKFYSENPIGYLTIVNKEKKEYTFRLKVESEDGTIKYISNNYELKNLSDITIPFYTIMTNLDQEQLVEKKIIYLNVLVNDTEYLLETFSIDMYNKTSWNGEFKDLTYFINSESNVIKTYAREYYRNAIQKFGNSDAIQQFETLKEFLTAVGSEFQYISDPVTTYQIDQVQRVEETLSNLSGDCEDLVTFLTSVLSSVGHESALISISPNTEKSQIGHVFMLINTNIPARFQNELNLSDFNSLIRNNLYQQKVIWIPFEVTLMNTGFKKAHEAGAKQYYEEVIEKDGVRKGRIKITTLDL